MDTAVLVMLLVVAVLLGGSLIYLIYYLTVNVFNPEGRGAEKKTARILKNFGRIRGYKVLSDIDLSVDGKAAHIENMLIGYFGILLVSTCGARGEYYGTLDSATWPVTRKDGREKTIIPNPMLAQRQAIAVLRALFAKNNVYKVAIDGVVYLTSRSNKTVICISNNSEILRPGKLSGYLSKDKYQNDAGHDVGKIAELIRQNALNK